MWIVRAALNGVPYENDSSKFNVPSGLVHAAHLRIDHAYTKITEHKHWLISSIAW